MLDIDVDDKDIEDLGKDQDFKEVGEEKGDESRDQLGTVKKPFLYFA